jgi:phosphopantothenoylcysteine decarboxylase/phosphopantothenate--cysteine ligase
MYEVAVASAASADIYIGAAAISDYRPRQVQQQKIKKKSSTLSLELVRSKDVLAEIAAMKSAPFTVGFAAETEKLEEHARGKLLAKKLDMIVGNLVGKDLCFERDDNSVLVLWQGGSEEIPRMAKTELGHTLIGLIADRYHQAASAPTPIRRPTAS